MRIPAHVGIAAFRRGVDHFALIAPHMQLSTMMIFLFVAERGPCTQKEVERQFGLSNASASRNIGYWSDPEDGDAVGAGLIERQVDPTDKRRRLLRLTPRGTEFFTRFMLALAEQGRQRRKPAARTVQPDCPIAVPGANVIEPV
jgi:DNA-binding MarR family transcriptional regulator